MEIIDLNENADSNESVHDMDELSLMEEKNGRKGYGKKDKKSSVMGEILSWISTFAIAIAAALVIKNYVIINANIPTGSMENTILPGDDIFGFRLAYTFSEPKRGDIIIFNAPDNVSEKFIKRIIGLPGETVTIEDAQVYIDGVRLEEDYLKEEEWVVSTGPYTFEIPEDSYLVLGDNRNGSSDAREWTNKYVSRDAIIGKAIFRYYPFNRFGKVE